METVLQLRIPTTRGRMAALGRLRTPRKEHFSSRVTPVCGPGSLSLDLLFPLTLSKQTCFPPGFQRLWSLGPSFLKNLKKKKKKKLNNLSSTLPLGMLHRDSNYAGRQPWVLVLGFRVLVFVFLIFTKAQFPYRN